MRKVSDYKKPTDAVINEIKMSRYDFFITENVNTDEFPLSEELLNEGINFTTPVGDYEMKGKNVDIYVDTESYRNPKDAYASIKDWLSGKGSDFGERIIKDLKKTGKAFNKFAGKIVRDDSNDYTIKISGILK